MRFHIDDTSVSPNNLSRHDVFGLERKAQLRLFQAAMLLPTAQQHLFQSRLN